jgi:hypothetical protein
LHFYSLTYKEVQIFKLSKFNHMSLRISIVRIKLIFKNMRMISYSHLDGLLLLFFVDLAWWLASFPGTFSPDSLWTWEQVKSGAFFNDHPVIFLFYIKALSVNLHFPWLISAFQLLLVSLTIFKLLGFFSNSINIRKRLYLTSGLMMFPFAGQMAVQVWKDIPYTCFSLLGLIMILNVQRSQKKYALGFILIGFGSTFRHDGLLVLILDVLIFAAYRIYSSKRKKNSNIAKLTNNLLTISLPVNVFLSMMLPIIVDAAPAPGSLRVYSFAHDLAYVVSTHPDEVSKDLSDFVLNYSTGNSLEGAKNCFNLSPMLYQAGWDATFVNTHWREFPSMWVKSLPKNWKSILYARICSGVGFYLPIPHKEFLPTTSNSYWNSEWLGWGSYEPTASTFGLSHSPKSIRLDKGIYWWRGLFGEFVNVLAWPGLQLLLILFIFRRLLKRRQIGSKAGMMILFVASRHLVLASAGVGLIYRYGFMTHLVFVSLLALFLEYSYSKPKGVYLRDTGAPDDLK